MFHMMNNLIKNVKKNMKAFHFLSLFHVSMFHHHFSLLQFKDLLALENREKKRLSDEAATGNTTATHLQHYNKWKKIIFCLLSSVSPLFSHFHLDNFMLAAVLHLNQFFSLPTCLTLLASTLELFHNFTLFLH